MVISVAALASILHLRLDLSIVLVVFCVGFSTSALVFFAALLASNFFSTFRPSCQAVSAMCQVARSPLASSFFLQLFYHLCCELGHGS